MAGSGAGSYGSCLGLDGLVMVSPAPRSRSVLTPYDKTAHRNVMAALRLTFHAAASSNR
jgi:hypothetical protein